MQPDIGHFVEDLVFILAAENNEEEKRNGMPLLSLEQFIAIKKIS